MLVNIVYVGALKVILLGGSLVGSTLGGFFGLVCMFDSFKGSSIWAKSLIKFIPLTYIRNYVGCHEYGKNNVTGM